MSKTLEEIGNALFKQWFVDFEFPDENGKPYKSSGGDMVDSELGKIPKGWKVKTLPVVAEIQKEPDGHKKINQYTRYATVLLCLFQGYGLAMGLEAIKSPNGLPVVIDPGYAFRFLTIVTIFISW